MHLEDIINIFKSRYEIDRYDPENGLPFIIIDRNIKVTVQNHHVLIEWKNLGIPSYIKTKKNKMLFGIGIQKAFVIQSGFYDSELLEIVEKCNLKATVIYDSVINPCMAVCYSINQMELYVMCIIPIMVYLILIIYQLGLKI